MSIFGMTSGNILKAKIKGGVACYSYQIYKHQKNRSRNLSGLAGIPTLFSRAENLKKGYSLMSISFYVGPLEDSQGD